MTYPVKKEVLEPAREGAPPEARDVESERAASGFVLVVDDSPEVCSIVGRWLERQGYRTESFPDGEHCLAALGRTLPDAICLDLDMPGLGGLRTLERIKSHHRLLPVIILTADAAVESVVAAMQLGAYDYLIKPVDPTSLVTTIRNAVDRHRMSLRLAQLEREVRGQGHPGILGSSSVMKDVYRQIDLVAASDITVLIRGESGTGKEIVARAIHAGSSRSKGAFVALNCAAVPESLHESELFGHEKGSFTGATERRLGKFEQAHRGTLFLDEVGELSPALQAKLLRVLQEQSFARVGGSKEVKSDFRLLAATNRELSEEVKAGRFREDLYFRIAVFEMDLPPLRKRGEDVLQLARAFLAEIRDVPSGGSDLSSDVARVLAHYAWPGNVRELRNVLHRAAVVAAGGVIRREHLPGRILGDLPSNALDTPTESPGGSGPEPRPIALDRASELVAVFSAPATEPPTPTEASTGAQQPGWFTLNLEQLERAAIAEAMSRTGGNLTQVVRLLGIGRSTLYRKLKRYKLE